jgi:hypothetical protein
VHHCKNCNTKFSGKFCHECGQKLFTSRDKSIKTLLIDAINFLTNFEGTFFNSIKAIFRHPAKLTNDYCNGIRKKYFKPISLFLFVVVLYLLFPVGRGLNMEMTNYKGNFIGRQIINKQIEEKTLELNISEKELSEIFKEKSDKSSKFLLFLLIPLVVLGILTLFPQKKSNIYDLTVLATEMNIFFISVYYLLIPLVSFLIFKIIKPSEDNLDSNGFILFFVLSFWLYAFLVFRNYFKQKTLVTIVKSLGFTFLFFFVLIVVYRFIVFEITFIWI